MLCADALYCLHPPWEDAADSAQFSKRPKEEQYLISNKKAKEFPHKFAWTKFTYSTNLH